MTTTPDRGPEGQLAHPQALAQTQRLAPEFFVIDDIAWCFVGNGLSNQTFIRGPQGIIAVDTGESVEEMRAALKQLRQHTLDPIVAVIYTHFHYVNGTAAIFEEPHNREVTIYAHEGIPGNLARFGGEIAPRSSRGIVHQFGTSLPNEGPDALLHCGLGLYYRNPEHRPFTPGYIPAQNTFTDALSVNLAGLRVDMQHAPSDATDSITVWLPDLKICVNNLIWPALFNIYAIRGEEYRDPRVLLDGIDHILDLPAEHLLGTHGPPLHNPGLTEMLTQYRDSIQFIWDQTVRGANKGLSLDELVEFVSLPTHYDEHYLTQQLYGLVEHHVRQIYTGLFGWFDEQEGNLLPLPGQEKAQRCINGFGGREAVFKQATQAMDDADYRWALELCAWLVNTAECAQHDRDLMAQILRQVAYQTPSANLRNWCLTRALEHEGSIDLTRHRQHRFSYHQVRNAPAARYVHGLRVVLDPTRSVQINTHIAWHFSDGAKAGLHIRNGVAVPTDGSQADYSLTLSQETWAEILGGKQSLSSALEEGTVSISGDMHHILSILQAFDVPGLR
ncbi:MAG: alkyl sulfatase dimerization domain-containing protein [Pseudomonadota bacterium]